MKRPHDNPSKAPRPTKRTKRATRHNPIINKTKAKKRLCTKAQTTEKNRHRKRIKKQNNQSGPITPENNAQIKPNNWSPRKYIHKKKPYSIHTKNMIGIPPPSFYKTIKALRINVPRKKILKRTMRNVQRVFGNWRAVRKRNHYM